MHFIFNLVKLFLCKSRLSSDGQRTLLVNLGSDTLKPEGWDKLAVEKPKILSFADISIYELHVRDFRYNSSLILLIISMMIHLQYFTIMRKFRLKTNSREFHAVPKVF